MSWREQALCVDLPYPAKYMFFGDAPGGATTITQNRYAQSICYTCPVQVDCLIACLQFGGTGVWGGLTDSQRKRYLLPALRRQGESRATYKAVIDSCNDLRHASEKVTQITQLVAAL